MMTPVEIVQQAYEYLNARDLLQYFSLMSPDVEFYQTVELSWGGHYRGLEESKTFFAKFAPLIDSTVEIAYYIPAGEQIVAIGKTIGIAKQTGKPFNCNLAHVWTVREERIVRLDVYIDTNQIKTALT